MNKITYVFKEGRVSRLSDESVFPKEFFYSFFDLNKKPINDCSIIELSKSGNLISNFIFKLIRKILKVPMYTEKILTYKNLKIFYHSTHIINTNQNIGYSTLPVIFFLKLFRNISISTFIMGFSDFDLEKKSKKILNSLLIKVSDNLIFLGEGEYKAAINKYKSYSDRFHLLPFCVDTEFWNNPKSNIKEFVLFIGNDKNRDYEFLIELIDNLSSVNFVVISSRMEKINKKNVTHIKGSWNTLELNDLEIKEFYSKSLLTILPLKESMQPSGQSVALQSMSMETPVLITKTSGFWDFENFRNNENIIFLNNSRDEWISSINKVIKNKDFSDKLSSNAKKIVNDIYNIEIFTKNLSEIIL